MSMGGVVHGARCTTTARQCGAHRHHEFNKSHTKNEVRERYYLQKILFQDCRGPHLANDWFNLTCYRYQWNSVGLIQTTHQGGFGALTLSRRAGHQSAKSNTLTPFRLRCASMSDLGRTDHCIVLSRYH